MNKAPVKVRCPTCGKQVAWTADSPWRPFCSARCRQIDLGAWASESYRVPSSPPDGEGGTGGSQDPCDLR